MGVDVVYVSDQKFFRSRGAWYTTASFPLDYIARRLDAGSWTFWGRLYDIDNPGRLYRLTPPSALEDRVFFEGPREQATGPLGYARAALTVTPRLRRAVRNADVVWLKLPFVFTLLAHRFCGPGQVVVSHQVGDARAGLALTYPRFALLGHVAARRCREISARADVAAFVSADLARSYGGARRDVVIANESRVTDDMVLAAPPERLAGPLEVIFVGRLAPEKCIDDLLKAVAQVPEARLSIVGDGPERPKLEALSRALNLGGRVTWRGYVPWGPGLLEMMLRSSVLALPSATEGLPLVIIEAMSQGVPAVAARVGGIPEIIEDGISGLLVDVHRPDQLAAAFRSLIAQPELRLRMARAALETARRNTIERQMSPMLERVRQACRARSAP